MIPVSSRCIWGHRQCSLHYSFSTVRIWDTVIGRGGVRATNRKKTAHRDEHDSQGRNGSGRFWNVEEIRKWIKLFLSNHKWKILGVHTHIAHANSFYESLHPFLYEPFSSSFAPWEIDADSQKASCRSRLVVYCRQRASVEAWILRASGEVQKPVDSGSDTFTMEPGSPPNSVVWVNVTGVSMSPRVRRKPELSCLWWGLVMICENPNTVLGTK